jgi:hypothetical protein
LVVGYAVIEAPTFVTITSVSNTIAVGSIVHGWFF